MLELTMQQKNQLFDVIRENGLNPSLFSWGLSRSKFNTVHGQYGEDPENAETLKISINEKEYYFTLEESNFHKYASSTRPRLSAGTYVGTDIWNSFLNYFAEWLSVIKYETEEPDLWKNPPTNPVFRVASDYADKGTFSEVEQRQIKTALKEIESKIRAKADLTPKQSLKLEQTFDYLQAKAETSSKVDWKNIFLGTMVSLLAEPWVAPYAIMFREYVLAQMAPVMHALSF